jgi:SpoVK/Ycf46/Vps4 family AAA+-type ATPase
MDWLAKLGKDNQMIVIEHKQKNGKRRTYTKTEQEIREYKQQYYLNNLAKYTERNRKASEERTLARIEALCHDAVLEALDNVFDYTLN